MSKKAIVTLQSGEELEFNSLLAVCKFYGMEESALYRYLRKETLRLREFNKYKIKEIRRK